MNSKKEKRILISFVAPFGFAGSGLRAITPRRGSSTYSDSYGDETSVVKMHSGNGEHDEMDRRAIACFDQALADVGLATTVHCDKCCTTTSLG